ncbi:hypothetical protein [Streptomyces sp. NBC_00101]
MAGAAHPFGHRRTHARAAFTEDRGAAAEARPARALEIAGLPR